jgi:broad specificity phosphatase PhoE
MSSDRARWFRRFLGPLGGPPWERPARRGERHLVLVRHAQAAAAWSADMDAGLSALGRRQAEAMADELASLGPLPVLVSPMRRCRETAVPLEVRWGSPARVEPAVGEIVAPSDGPPGDDAAQLEARGTWLRTAMAGRWSDLGPEHQAWRTGVVDALRAIPQDAVVVTHFVAINAAVGAAMADDRIVCFSPANCSRTILRVDDSGLTVLAFGDDDTTTRVL